MEEHSGPWFEQYLELLHNPAHWAFEITVTIVIDLVILYFGYQILWKKVILPKVRRDIHEEIDRDHDLLHVEYSEQDLILARKLKGSKFGVDARVILPSGRVVTQEELTRLINLRNEEEGNVSSGTGAVRGQ